MTLKDKIAVGKERREKVIREHREQLLGNLFVSLGDAFMCCLVAAVNQIFFTIVVMALIASFAAIMAFAVDNGIPLNIGIIGGVIVSVVLPAFLFVKYPFLSFMTEWLDSYLSKFDFKF
jgi:hypothetical protein